MLILLFIFALIRHLNGAPTAIPPLLVCDPTDLYIRDNPIHRHLTSRTVNDIVVSCLATVFACTWTAIHPNIPSPCDSGWEIFKRQITTMVYAIFIPEMITVWALRQNLAARRIAREYNRDIGKISEVTDKRSWFVRFAEGVKGWFYRTPLEGVKEWFSRHPAPRLAKKGEVEPWSITHGFFVQMGGFLICEDGKPVITLDIDEHLWTGHDYVTGMEYWLEQKRIDTPKITKGEIEDRSKGDGLTKTIVVLQTTWFIAQCIVRWSSRLPVTELEILTLGFAALNGVTYALWWHKPQSVRMPVYLEKKGTAGSTTEELGEVVEGGQSRALDGDSVTSMEVALEQVEVMAGGAEMRGQGDDGADERKSQVAGRAQIAADPAPPAKRSHLSKILEDALRDRWKIIWRIPFALIEVVLRPLVKMIDPSKADIEMGKLRVPMFHSGDADAATLAIATSAIGSIFGLTHFIPAFFLVFSSPPEMFLWRISAGIIAVHPIFIAVFAYYIDDLRGILQPLLLILLLVSSAMDGIAHLARLALITLAFLSLRTLHDDALATVDWISFIPHL